LIELNHILLFLALISPLAVLVRGWRLETAPSWRNAALLELLVTGAGWVFFRRQAGFVGATAWLALLFLPAIGLKRVAELAARRRFAAARKLANALRILHPSRELRHQAEFLRTLELRQAQGLISPPSIEFGRGLAATVRRNRLYGSWAVISLIVMNLAVFALEGRSSTDPLTLSRLGALDPGLVIRGHEYWRLGTALFLHYGWAHLLFNLFALYILGPALERAIGGVRFLVCYLLSGLGSSAGVVLLTLAHVVHPAQLVGASGCVMGVVGAWAGYLLLHRHAPDAKRRLSNILIIIAVQIAFDISTPQVSMSAHLCGLVTGFFLGLAIAPRGLTQTGRSAPL
jgi:membrane associated rhomboid family serine protease